MRIPLPKNWMRPNWCAPVALAALLDMDLDWVASLPSLHFKKGNFGGARADYVVNTFERMAYEKGRPLVRHWSFKSNSIMLPVDYCNIPEPQRVGTFIRGNARRHPCYLGISWPTGGHALVLLPNNTCVDNKYRFPTPLEDRWLPCRVDYCAEVLP